MGNRKVTLTQRIFSRFTNDYGELKCRRCGGKLKVGDVVMGHKNYGHDYPYRPNKHPKKNNPRRKTFYHLECWDGMFF